MGSNCHFHNFVLPQRRVTHTLCVFRFVLSVIRRTCVVGPNYREKSFHLNFQMQSYVTHKKNKVTYKFCSVGFISRVPSLQVNDICVKQNQRCFGYNFFFRKVHINFCPQTSSAENRLAITILIRRSHHFQSICRGSRQPYFV